MNVQDLALQKYANHQQILKLFKAGRNVQSLNKRCRDEREGKSLARGNWIPILLRKGFRQVIIRIVFALSWIIGN